MIFSSYYGRKNLVRICASRGLEMLCVSNSVARGFEGIRRSEEVIPSWDIVMEVKRHLDYRRYKLRYWDEILRFVDVKAWIREHDNSVMLCFERDVVMCHRYLLGKWINWGCDGMYGGEL